MSSYCSFLVFSPEEATLVQALCAEAKMPVTLIDDPSGKFEFVPNGMTEYANPVTAFESRSSRTTLGHPGKVLVLNTCENDADNFIDLVHASDVILEGFPDIKRRSHALGFEIPKDETERTSVFENFFQTTGYFQEFSHKPERAIALAMTLNALQSPKSIYAIHKLAQSYRTQAITPWSTHPRHGLKFEKHSANYATHVLTALAINLAYSAIEELGVEVRSSRERPRWAEVSSLTWNNDVLRDIQARLLEIGISTSDTVSWIARGDQTEVMVQPLQHREESKQNSFWVRDRELSLPDAIHACSYLRNFLTAHAFGTETPKLGPYEVFNTQHVARRLVLSSCGTWQTCIRDLEEIHLQ